jgi:putative peptide zinc metalloprotease protein
LLIEHDRAAELPAFVAAAPSVAALTAMLGGAGADRQLVDDLVSEGILSDRSTDSHPGPTTGKRVTFSRSGIEFTGIDTVARAIYRVLWPVLSSWAGRMTVGALVITGVASLIMGRPGGLQVSQHPWVDATVGLLLSYALSGVHELAHAVTLVHYGRTPKSAGCGFYWGSVCFYVDSSDGITLPRRARIINALAGLATDLVTASVLFTLSHAFAGVTLIMAVCWRVGVTQLIGIVENGLPILEVDGHVAFADYLDEPDLSPRSRDALSRRLRGQTPSAGEPSWLAAYGALSVVGGIALMVAGTWVWWLAAGDLIVSLLGGSIVDMLLGFYIVVPFALAVMFSAIGLALEFFTKLPAADADPATAPDADISRPVQDTVRFAAAASHPGGAGHPRDLDTIAFSRRAYRPSEQPTVSLTTTGPSQRVDGTRNGRTRRLANDATVRMPVRQALPSTADTVQHRTAGAAHPAWPASNVTPTDTQGTTIHVRHVR